MAHMHVRIRIRTDRIRSERSRTTSPTCVLISAESRIFKTTKPNKFEMKKEARTDNMDDLEEALEADLSRVSSTMSNQDQGELMSIVIASNHADDGCIVEVRSGENVAESTRKALDLSKTREFVVLMGEDELDLEESFERGGGVGHSNGRPGRNAEKLACGI